MNLENAVAIVTGGASGLGAATARRLTRLGATVAILDRDQSRGQSFSQTHERLHFFPCDVTDGPKLEAVMAEVEERLGLVGAAVTCAGVGDAGRALGRNGPLPLEVFEGVVSVNLIGTFNLVRLAAERMSRRAPDPTTGERGLIVMTASVAAFDGQIGQAAYAASKAGVVGMTLPLARELARFGIRVLSIAPGLFDTPMMSGLRPDIREAMEASVPFPSRLGQPEEYAALVEHLLSNPMLNGETIRLDGALRLAPK